MGVYMKLVTRKPYKSDLTDREWEALKALIPPPKPGGRPRSVNVREILNAIFYVLRTGCSWNMLPHDFPPSSTVYYYFRRWQRVGVWDQFEAMLQKLGRKSLSPSAAGPTEERSYSAQSSDRDLAFQAPMAASAGRRPGALVALQGSTQRRRA